MIKRYACVPFIITEDGVHDSQQLMANCTKGPWVKYSAHEKEVALLQADINKRIDVINDLCRKLATTESELSRYKTPNVDTVTLKNGSSISFDSTQSDDLLIGVEPVKKARKR